MSKGGNVAVADGTSRRGHVETLQNNTDNPFECLVYRGEERIPVMVPARYRDGSRGLRPGKALMPGDFLDQIKGMPSLQPLFEAKKLVVGDVEMPGGQILGLGRIFDPPKPKQYEANGRPLEISDYSSYVDRRGN